MPELILRAACLACLLACLTPALAADKELQAGGMWAKVLGQSGKIDLAPSKDVAGDPNKVRIQIEALRELDSAGKELGNGGNSKHSFNSFATQDFTFGTLEDTTYGGVKCIKLPFTSTLGPGSKVEIQVFMFKENGTIAAGGETFAVTNSTMKFNVKLSDWVWCSGNGDCKGTDGVGQSVELDISVTSKEEAKKTAGAGQVYSLGGGAQMRFSSKIQIDGASTWTEMTTAPALTGSGTTSKFTLKFPKFTTSVLYDPDITYGSTSTSTGGATVAAATGSAGHPEGVRKLLMAFVTFCCLWAASV
jgi:hypothetical protein